MKWFVNACGSTYVRELKKVNDHTQKTYSTIPGTVDMYEWYHDEYSNKIYAYVRPDVKWKPPELRMKFPILTLPDGRRFKMTGSVGDSDAGWISAGFNVSSRPGYSSQHPIRRAGFSMSGKDSLADICYAVFTAKQLVEYSMIK